MNKVLLLILDGFGLAPVIEGNAFLQAKTPTFNALLRATSPLALHAAGVEVGLSWGEVGNSEVGHFNLGIGQVVWQDLPTISEEIKTGAFAKRPALLEAARRAKTSGGTLHLIGLCSNGGVHAHIDHLVALLNFAKSQGVPSVRVHMIADGRDTAPQAAQEFVNSIELAGGLIATVSGRYFAMDRDNRWDRITAAYLAMTANQGEQAASAKEAIENAYGRKETDEFIKPTIIIPNYLPIKSGDAVIFFNYRADRARQLTKAFLKKDQHDFPHTVIPNLYFATMTPYESDWKVEIAVVFPPKQVDPPLSKVISTNGLAQFHIAETEKYAHVTYFFNGGVEQQFPLEERKLIPSPKVATYDETPQMSAPLIVKELGPILASGKYPFVLANFANPDMVGHTGNLKATIAALESVDQALASLLPAAQRAGYQVLITGDHGNCEQMLSPETGEIDKEHTVNPVPLVYLPTTTLLSLNGAASDDIKLSWSQVQPIGVLADVAPTICELLGLPASPEMTGASLLGSFGSMS